MKHTHTITFQDHVNGHTDTAEIYDDGPKFRISLPTGEGRERIELLVNAFVVALWGDTCP